MVKEENICMRCWAKQAKGRWVSDEDGNVFCGDECRKEFRKELLQEAQTAMGDG